MTTEINYKQLLQDSFPLIEEWINNQSEETKQTEYFQEFQRVFKEIQQENDFSENAYEDIRYLFRSFEFIPLKLKRIFNIAMMDQYTMFISTRFFDSLEDHINLVMSTSRFKYNMEKFHYNPISLNQLTISFFPNVETFHVYDDDGIEENDDDSEHSYDFYGKEQYDYVEGGRIKQYVDWRKLNYYQSIEIKERNEKKLIEFKRIIWSSDDVCDEIVRIHSDQSTPIENDDYDDYDNFQTIEVANKYIEIRIPESVKEIYKLAFSRFETIGSIVIPTTVTKISSSSFYKCSNLRKIQLPLKQNQIICGNRIYSTPHLKMDINLPVHVNSINGEKVIFSEFFIPTTVTSIDEKCFEHNRLIIKLSIPSSISEIPFHLLSQLKQLQHLKIPSCYEAIGNKLFLMKDGCIKSFDYPSTIKTVNGKRIKPLETFTIPSNITKLLDFCFANSSKLTEINGLEHVKEIGKGCFFGCNNILEEKYPIVKQNKEDYLDELFNDFLSREERMKLYEWTGLQCYNILFDSTKDDWLTNCSNFNEKIEYKKQLAFVIEDEDGEKFGYYFNSSVYEYTDFVHELGKLNADLKTFHFNLSSNGRLKEPMKFEKVSKRNGAYFMQNISNERLIILGNISLFKKDVKEKSYTLQNDWFNYHGIEKALCGKVGNMEKGEHFTPKRFIVIQMK